MYNACNVVAKWKMECTYIWGKLLCYWFVEEYLTLTLSLSLSLAHSKNNFLGGWRRKNKHISLSLTSWINYYYYYWVIEKFYVFAICVKCSPYYISFSFWSKSLWTIFFSFDSQTMSTLKEKKWTYEWINLLPLEKSSVRIFNLNYFQW